MLGLLGHPAYDVAGFLKPEGAELRCITQVLCA